MTKQNEADKKWYMVTSISGKEEQVIEALKNRVVSEQMQDFFADFDVMLIPILSAKELAKKLAGEKFKVKYRNLFPGYIFIKMHMTNEAWFLVRNTQYITGLVGSSGQRTKPTPVSEDEIAKMRHQRDKIVKDFERGVITTPFLPGRIVEVIDGPHKGQIGPILENNDAQAVSTVELVLFNRKTQVTLSHKFLQLKN